MLLGRPRRSDVSWLIEACNNRPEINQVSPDIPYPYRAADARAFVDRDERVRGQRLTHHSVIEREDDAEPLGVIELHLGDLSMRPLSSSTHSTANYSLCPGRSAHRSPSATRTSKSRCFEGSGGKTGTELG